MQAVIRMAFGICVGAWLASGNALGQPAPRGDLGPGLASDASPSVLLVEPLAEKIVENLPAGPLYWRVERFSSLEAAKASEGPWSLAAIAWGEVWLVTLGNQGDITQGARKIAEVGPIPPSPSANRFLLRVNRAGGPPGSKTPVHTHPGSEAFLVLKGQLTQRTPHGLSRVDAGNVMNGHEPGMVMQLESTGSEQLEQLVMFVVDAEKPFSAAARFEP
jgi:quercetin dioxygenase-like cupin family protein